MLGFTFVTWSDIENSFHQKAKLLPGYLRQCSNSVVQVPKPLVIDITFKRECKLVVKHTASQPLYCVHEIELPRKARFDSQHDELL